MSNNSGNTLLEQLDGILLAAEEADTFSEDSVNEIFRIMHTPGFRTFRTPPG